MIFLQEDVEVLINKKALRTDLFIQDYGDLVSVSPARVQLSPEASMIHNFLKLHFYYDTAHA